jgi:PhnB protein
MKVNPVPEGFHSVTPYLSIHHVRKTIEFLKGAFDASEVEVHAMPDGRIMNAIIKIGDSMIFMGEQTPDKEPWPGMLYMYVKDVDAAFKKASHAGGKVVCEPMDMFYGERSGAVEDPSGNQWWMSSQIEKMSNEELVKRAAENKR